MPNMELIPVIDLLRGEVVRGIAGQRETYRPIESLLAPDARPATVAKAFAAMGLKTCYVADLDAIAGASPDWQAYQAISQAGLEIWIDAGVRDERRARELATFSHHGEMLARIIVGLESLSRPDTLTRIIETHGTERVIFSLDLRHGQPIALAEQWRRFDALAIADTVIAAGVNQLLVLDLGAVGVYGGPATLSLCSALRSQYAQLTIISGGGVRCEEDLDAFANAGCDFTLVASALHDGRIAPRAERLQRQRTKFRAIRPET